ncbi:hypothetical protein [Dyella subtropica]|uniref:hypothetical protein n=1 Tax=Dyella subtropica TaxID=2992127 RepID=UPI0022592B83|nr:hypothetical protein [Dyella subtropica]
MHLELPKERLHSLKDFSKHYLMIVLSILTALGLEAWIEHTHHRHAAAEAGAKIEAEIQQNLAEIRRVREHDAARLRELSALRDALSSDLKAHVPDEVIHRHVRQATPHGLYLDYRWPMLRREAWDVTVANQSAGWIESERLRNYSTIYAMQTLSGTIQAQDIPMVLDGPRMIDAMLDVQADDYQPRELLRVVNQMAGAASELVNMLDNLTKKIETNLPADQRPHA